MTVTVNDILKLEIMKNFKVVAGASGLEKSIETTEILDFEFLQEGKEYRDHSFVGNSVVLTSLLFAKDDPELVLDAVKRLNRFNVHALAYKPVIFRELPKEALKYADEVGMPILEFGNDEFFEDIIFAVKDLTRRTEDLERLEPMIGDMMHRVFDEKECREAIETANPLLRPYIMAYCIKCKGADERELIHKIKFTIVPDELRQKIFIGIYHERYILIVSGDDRDQARYEKLAETVMETFDLEDATVGASKLFALGDGIDNAIRQAYWSERIAEIDDVPVRHYDELGINQLFIPWPGTSASEEFMNEYLAPLFEDGGKDDELLKTAEEYILTKGNMALTAEKMFCHKNTIRYRVGKLQEKLDPDSGEKTFYQNLSAAVIIYLLNKRN